MSVELVCVDGWSVCRALDPCMHYDIEDSDFTEYFSP